MKKKCKWTYDDTHDMYETACGEAFCFMEGNRKDNGIKYCPFCSKPIDKRTK